MHREAVGAMKESAVTRPDKSCQEVYQDVLADHAERLGADHDFGAIAAALPTYNNVRSSLQRQRSSAQGAPLPTCRAQLSLAEVWTKTRSGEDFLLINDATPAKHFADRILGFCTGSSLKILAGTRTVFMDGTFDVVPRIFGQLYTLHGFYKGQMLPLAYFLLPDKEAQTYTRMFNLLREKAEDIGLAFEPQAFQVDYEASILKAIRECFPSAQMHGCNFHFTQAVWRAVQRKGLVGLYKSDPVIKK